jgi:drug/metabolite transporter (DMT)-like permease
LVLLVVFALLEDVSATLRAAPWGKIVLLGIVGVALSTFLFAWGIQLSSAVAGALIAATGPIVAALIGVVFKQPLQKGIVLGILLAVSGGICAALANGAGTADFRGGEIVVLLAMAIWVWYSYNCQRWLKGLSQVSIAALTVATGSIGFAAYAAVAELSGFHDVRFGTELKEWLLIGWLSIGPASTAIFLWHFGVSRVGVTIGSMYQNLVPIIVVLITISLGRYPSYLHLIAGVLIIAGVLYTQIRNLSAGR